MCLFARLYSVTAFCSLQKVSEKLLSQVEVICKLQREMSKSVKLTAKWQLDAALLSRPVDLTALVTMSRSSPEMLIEDNTLHRLVSSLLNEKNDKKSDKVSELTESILNSGTALYKRVVVLSHRIPNWTY